MDDNIKTAKSLLAWNSKHPINLSFGFISYENQKNFGGDFTFFPEAHSQKHYERGGGNVKYHRKILIVKEINPKLRLLRAQISTN